MNIKQKHKVSKKIILILVASIVLVGLVTSLYYYLAVEGSENEQTVTPGMSDSKQAPQKEEKPSSSTPDSEKEEIPYETIAPPASTPPNVSVSFPVETAEYRIDRVNDSSYNITLYPIEGTDYESQLKNYKNNALLYLNMRVGSTDNLNIQWTPKSAENI